MWADDADDLTAGPIMAAVDCSMCATRGVDTAIKSKRNDVVVLCPHVNAGYIGTDFGTSGASTIFAGPGLEYVTATSSICSGTPAGVYNFFFKYDPSYIWAQQYVTSELEMWRAREAANRAKYEAERAAKAIVAKRADKLLLSMLSRKQRHTYERFRFIVVQSPTRPGVTYKIPAVGRVREFVNGKPVRDLCIHSREYGLPPGDEVLTLKLLIETDEAELIKASNVTYLDRNQKRSGNILWENADNLVTMQLVGAP